jgi:hypothetical protein
VSEQTDVLELLVDYLPNGELAGKLAIEDGKGAESRLLLCQFS